MSNKTIIKSSMEFNRHELDALDHIRSKYHVDDLSRNDLLRVGIYALKYMDNFTPDFEQFKNDLKHFLKYDKIYIRDGVRAWLKI